MTPLLRAWDSFAAWVAHNAATLGQLALLCLGVHLAADRLDDLALRALRALQGLVDPAVAAVLGRVSDRALERWADLDLVVPAAWIALLTELAADAIFAATIFLTDRERAPTFRAWRRLRTVESVVVPFSLAGVLLAGAWSLAMGIEDLIPHSTVGAIALAIAALLRFGWPAWARAVSHLDPSRRWTQGLAPALVLAPIGWLAWSHGVPLWGWLP